MLKYIKPLMGLSWEQIKQKLESEGAKNKQYDIDGDGLVENIGFKSVAELPATPKDYEIVLYRDAVRFYDPNKEKWASLWYLFGYDRFDSHGGGVWTKYINIPITTSPSEYAQYIVVIDSNNVTVYSADGMQKVQGAVASDFWANVKSDGSDIRVFDQAKGQLYFWIDFFDYSNKKAVIWVKLEAGSSELNIAYGNPRATESAYNNKAQVVEDVFTDPGFETLDGWTYYEQDESADGAYYEHPYTDWYTEGTASVYLCCAFSGAYTGTYYARLKQSISPTFDIVVYFDVKTKTVTSDYGVVEVLVDDTQVWSTTQADTELLDQKITISAGSHTVTFGTRVNSGSVTRYAIAAFDNIRVLKLADPADFGTPQIVEF